jgi:AraC-like DNA-binding protein
MRREHRVDALHLHLVELDACGTRVFIESRNPARAGNRLMLVDGMEAAAAGHRVGYESPSQFSREYRRLFGAPPRREIASVRLATA